MTEPSAETALGHGRAYAYCILRLPISDGGACDVGACRSKAMSYMVFLQPGLGLDDGIRTLDLCENCAEIAERATGDVERRHRRRAPPAAPEPLKALPEPPEPPEPEPEPEPAPVEPPEPEPLVRPPAGPTRGYSGSDFEPSDYW